MLVWPVQGYTSLSATFGEYRPGHYHAGIDISLGGRTGAPVRAVDFGTVDYCRASRTGYGNVIFLRHQDGTRSVYAHLDSFAEPLWSLVREAQRTAGRYEVEVYPPEPVRYEAGEVLAYGGASGTRAPHLHFEIRDRWNRPLNPLRYLKEFVNDSQPPVLEGLLIEPADSASRVAGLPWPMIYSNSRSTLPASVVIPARGRVRLALRAYDTQAEGNNKLGLYSVALSEQEVPLFAERFDRFSYERGNEEGLSYRLERTGLGPTRYTHRLYGEGVSLEAHDPLVMSRNPSAGTIDLSSLTPGESRTLVLRAGDVFGNTRSAKIILIRSEEQNSSASLRPLEGIECRVEEGVLEFLARNETLWVALTLSEGISEEEGLLELLNQNGMILRGDFLNRQGKRYYGALDLKNLSVPPGTYRLRIRFKEKEISYPIALGRFLPNEGSLVLEHPEKEAFLSARGDQSFYPETLFLFSSKEDPKPVAAGLEMMAGPYCFIPEGTPAKSQFEISIKAPLVDDESEADSFGIYAWDEEAGQWRYAGRERRNGNITVSVRSLSTFAVLADHAPPRLVKSSPAAGAWINSPEMITLTFSDVGSGIDADRVNVLLDENPLKGYFDRYKGIYFSDPLDPLERGAHVLAVEVYDRAGNPLRGGGEKIVFTIR